MQKKLNDYSLEYWKNSSENIKDVVLACKFNSANDHSHMDADFILQFAHASSSILDLGSGTGGIVNKIYDKVGGIVCVDAFAEFTKHIVSAANVQIKNATIADFECDTKFDLITMFGIMHYFSGSEANDIYRKYFRCLKDGGRMIVKNQFGVNEDVDVDGYSEEMQCNYYSQYRHLPKECAMLEQVGFRHVAAHDIYPAHCNRWNNTHFYAIVAQK